MDLSSERIHRAIIESIEDTVKEFEKINSRHQLTPWDPATKMDRMRPTNASRAMCNTPVKDFKIHSYDDWVRNYKPQGISWKEYNSIEL